MQAVVANAVARQWIASRIGLGHLSRAARGICAVDERGTIRGGVLYDTWAPNSVQAHMATETPIAWRALLPHVFIYPFLGPKADGADGRGVIFSLIRGSNARSLAMAKSLGFREADRIRDGYNMGEDYVRVEMRREECRFLHGWPRAARKEAA